MLALKHCRECHSCGEYMACTPSQQMFKKQLQLPMAARSKKVIGMHMVMPCYVVQACVVIQCGSKVQ